MKIKQFIIILIFVLLPLVSVQAGRNRFCDKFPNFSGCIPEASRSTECSASNPDCLNMTIKTVIVGKADGSLQCKPESGLSPDQMAEELEEVNILSSFIRYDYFDEIAMKCGNETGIINAYEIPVEDLEKALEKDFVLLFVPYINQDKTKNPQITIIDTGVGPIAGVSPFTDGSKEVTK